jgi:hypothetical protein
MTIKIRQHSWYVKDSHIIYSDSDQTRTLGLLRVCRRVYTETTLLPYALNEWFIPIIFWVMFFRTKCYGFPSYTPIQKHQWMAISTLGVTLSCCSGVYKDDFCRTVLNMPALKNIIIYQDIHHSEEEKTKTRLLRDCLRELVTHKTEVVIIYFVPRKCFFARNTARASSSPIRLLNGTV